MKELEYVFVYGIFRDVYHKLLGDAVYCDNAFVFGKMYRVNEFYPGYKRIDCSNMVHGDVYLVHPSVIPTLDEFEGEEYKRKKIWTSIGEECWIYEYKYSVSEFKEVLSGDWILR